MKHICILNNSTPMDIEITKLHLFLDYYVLLIFIVGCNRKTVYIVLKRYQATGSPCPNLKVPHKKTSTTPEIDAAIIQYSEKHPFEVASKVKETLDINASVDTVKRKLREAGLHGRKAAKKPSLTPHHKECRLLWAENRRFMDWDLIVFSDESMICTSDSGVIWVRRPRNQRFEQKYIAEITKSGRVSISVWGFMWRDSLLDLKLIPGRLTGQRYIDEILEPSVAPFLESHPELVFQQDNASIHTARIVKTYMSAKNIYPLPHPAKSPDVNIIEHIWKQLKMLIGPVNHIKTTDQLWRVTKEAWEILKTEQIHRDIIPKLYASMPKRCQAIIDANGGATKY